MTGLFISYSRDDSVIVDEIVKLLRSRYGEENVWHDANLKNHNGEIWWEEILRQIKQSGIFVYCLSKESLESPYCQAEFKEAQRLRKRIIYIQVRDRTSLPEQIKRYQYTDLSHGVNESAAKITSLYNSIERQIKKIPVIPLKPTSQIPTPCPTRHEPKIAQWLSYTIAILGLGLLIAFFAYNLLARQETDNFASGFSSLIPSSSAAEEEAIRRAFHFDGTLAADWMLFERDFEGVRMVLVPVGCFRMGADPSAFYWDDGQTTQGIPDAGEQCFDKPFWIDKYEVTNGQFRRLLGHIKQTGKWTEDNAPVQHIKWQDAVSFCQQRGGRLPTEREWEYAARGVENFVYPWGNEFHTNRVIYRENSNNRTAIVGSRPNGASWVGAFDMAGNVWEWTLSKGYSYPYDAKDGREVIDNNHEKRIVRGGSWSSYALDTRATYRAHENITPGFNNIGFRCMRNV